MSANSSVIDQQSLRAYKKKYNFFETPVEIADRMGELLAEMGRGIRILEPSAGLGVLIRAAKRHCLFDPQIDFCEIQQEFYPYLAEWNRVGSNFLWYQPGPIYDAVIMNPPYRSMGAKKHTDHAWYCLKPGGRLVVLVSKVGADFIDEEFYGHIFYKEKFEKGFTETTVDTFLFLIHKPLI